MGEEEKKADEGKKGQGEKPKAAAEGEKAKAEEEKPKAAEEKKEKGGGGSGDGEKKVGGEGDAAAVPVPPPPPEEIVMRVYMHCEGCARKVRRCLKGFEGVEEVSTDCRAHRVVVKGRKAAEDPLKVVERVQRKSGRKVELLTPLPPPKPEKKPEEKEVKPKPEEKKEEPPVIAVVLTVHMHCEACAQEIKKRILKMKGVQSAEPELKASQVTVKGVFDPPKLVEYVYKRTGKHAVVVKTEPVEKKPEDEKPKDEKKPEGENKDKPQVEEKEKKEGSGGGGEKEKDGGAAEVTGDGAAPKVVELQKNEFYYYYPTYPVQYHSHPPYAYAPYAYLPYAYPPPQLFSDENPNACSVM